MKKIIYFVAIEILLILFVGFASAGMDNFARAEQIIEQRISCSNLSLDDLEVLGDFYMEQMHPGDLHEIMDERMGGEGSENLRQVHINMGKMFYCGEPEAMSEGMMNMMMGRSMMQGFGNMMGNSYYSDGTSGFGVFSWIVMSMVIVVLALLIVWLVKQLQPREKKASGKK